MRKTVSTAVALIACVASFGQNINPTVEVTNTYQGDPSEIHKPATEMAIPDSLLRFDMDFNYEVFEKPYQGAYNFKPYMLAMKPDKDAYRGREVYLRAGAGYSFHPQLDFAFSPEPKGPFQMSVHASHRGYYGKYNTLAPFSEDGITKIDKVAGQSFKGHEGVTTVGVEGSYVFDNAILSFGAGYEGVMTGDTLVRKAFNAGGLNVRLRSNRDDESYLFYDVTLGGKFGAENRKVSSYVNQDSYYYYGIYGVASFPDYTANLGERILSLNANIGPVLDRTQSILLGVEAESVSYSNMIDAGAGRIALVPKYLLSTGIWDFSLGLRVEKLLGISDRVEDSFYENFIHKGSMIFPDVHVSWLATPSLSLYASATGGNKLNGYSTLLERNHFISPIVPGFTMDASTERVNAKIGARGKLGTTLQFDVDGGFAVLENGLADMGVYLERYYFSPWINSYSVATPMVPLVTYDDYNLLYADALLALSAGDFKLDAGLHFRNMAFKSEANSNIGVPKFTFNTRAVYNFDPRLYAGVTMEAATARKGANSSYGIKVPGYLDLGLIAGWQFNRKLGFWLESGNLLCETVQRNLFYAEKDLWITAGITLSL